MQMTGVNVCSTKTQQEINEQHRKYYIVGLRLQNETYLEESVNHLTPSPVLQILGLSVRDLTRMYWNMDFSVQDFPLRVCFARIVT